MHIKPRFVNQPKKRMLYTSVNLEQPSGPLLDLWGADTFERYRIQARHQNSKVRQKSYM